jgi:hypothetical protein
VPRVKYSSKYSTVIVKMSAPLDPSLAVMSTIRTTIQNNLKADLPSDLLANIVAPFLSQVNRWSTQIPVILEGSGPPLAANLVFAIRKDLFGGPQFNHCVLATSASELPAPFQEFQEFISKLIEAQKGDPKFQPKVSPSSLYHCASS